MKQKIFRIATRKSPLALWQAQHIQQQLQSYWPTIKIELLPLVTSGDKFLKDKLLAIGGKGLFVKELEEALLDKRADFAVHSMKDVPAEHPAGLLLNTICKRDNPFDAFISQDCSTIESLPKAAVIGTSSLRRQSQLLALRPDLNIQPLRGNIHTRLRKLEDKSYQAIILAVAGLERMGMLQKIRYIIDPKIMLPACGQGALGIECRADDKIVQDLLAPLNDPFSALAVHTERRVNALLGGNCHVPLAVFCQLHEDRKRIHIQARVLNEDGSICINNTQIGNSEEALILAERCSEALLELGAKDLLKVVK